MPIKCLGALIAKRTKQGGFGDYAVVVTDAAEFVTGVKKTAIDKGVASRVRLLPVYLAPFLYKIILYITFFITPVIVVPLAVQAVHIVFLLVDVMSGFQRTRFAFSAKIYLMPILMIIDACMFFDAIKQNTVLFSSSNSSTYRICCIDFFI